MFNVGSAAAYFKLNTTGWTTGVGRVNASLASLNRTFVRFGAVALGSLTLIEREFGKFDKAIRHATSVSETTEAQFRQMSEMALDASVRWNKAATDTAQAFYYLGSAGLTVTEQMQAFNDTIMLSRAMGSELSQTVEGMVDIVRAFGLEFANSRDIADQLTKTVISSNLHFQDLDHALSYVSSTARLTNNTLAETNAMLGVMANAGIKGSMAGTVLRRAMTNLMSPTGEMAGLMYELGLRIYDDTGKMKPFIQIMGEISDKLEGVSDAYKNMVFEVLFGRRAIAGQITLFNYGSTALRKYANEIKNAGGTTEKVAGKQMKAFSEVLGQMGQEVKRAAIEIGGTLAPAIERVGNTIRSRLEIFRAYVAANREAIAETLKWTIVFGTIALIGPPVLLIFTNLVTQLGALTAAMIKFGVATFTNPFVVLLLSLYTFRAIAKKEGFWEDVWSTFKSYLDKIAKYAEDKFKTVAYFITQIASGRYNPNDPYNQFELEQFAHNWEVEWGNVSDVLSASQEVIKEKAGYIADALREALAEDIPVAMGIFKKAMDGLSPKIGEIAEAIKKALGEVKGMYKVFMQDPKDPFGIIAWQAEQSRKKIEEWGNELETVREILTGKDMSKIANGWREALEKMFQPMPGTGTTWGTMFVDALTDIRTAWADTIGDMLNEGTTFKNFLENMFLSILQAFNRMVAQIMANEMLYALFGGKMGMGTGIPRLRDFVAGVSGGSSRTEVLNPITPDFGSYMQSMQKAVPVAINIENNGVPVSARVAGQHWNGREYVVSVVMDEYNTNPNFRNALRQ